MQEKEGKMYMYMIVLIVHATNVIYHNEVVDTILSSAREQDARRRASVDKWSMHARQPVS